MRGGFAVTLLDYGVEEGLDENSVLGDGPDESFFLRQLQCRAEYDQRIVLPVRCRESGGACGAELHPGSKRGVDLKVAQHAERLVAGVFQLSGAESKSKVERG